MVKKQPNYKLHTLYALTTAFLIVFGLHIANGRLSLWNPEQSESTLRNTFRADAVGNAMKAWAVLALVLFSMSAFDSTAPLSAAFAWLILIAVLLMNADRLLAIAGSNPYGNVTGKGGGTGGGVNKLNRPL